MRRFVLVGALIVTVAIVGVAIGLIWTAARPVGSTGGKPTSAVEATAKVEPARARLRRAGGRHDLRRRRQRAGRPRERDGRLGVRVLRARRAPHDRASRRGGAISTITYRYPLRCLGEGCDPVGARQTVDFPTGRVGYLFHDTVRRAFSELDWPGHQVTGRVTPANLDQIDWHASVARIPEPTYRVEPLRLATGILLLAIAIAVAGGWLAWRLLRPEKGVDEETIVVRKLSPLEQALAAAGFATESGNTHRAEARPRTRRPRAHGCRRGHARGGRSRARVVAERLVRSTSTSCGSRVAEIAARRSTA